MKNIVHVYLLIESILEITSEKVENLFLEIQFFDSVSFHTPLKNGILNNRFHYFVRNNFKN